MFQWSSTFWNHLVWARLSDSNRTEFRFSDVFWMFRQFSAFWHQELKSHVRLVHNVSSLDYHKKRWQTENWPQSRPSYTKDLFFPGNIWWHQMKIKLWSKQWEQVQTRPSCGLDLYVVQEELWTFHLHRTASAQIYCIVRTSGVNIQIAPQHLFWLQRWISEAILPSHWTSSELHLADIHTMATLFYRILDKRHPLPSTLPSAKLQRIRKIRSRSKSTQPNTL